MVRPLPLPPVRGGVLLGLFVGLVACGRVSLGSLEGSDDSRAGAGGDGASGQSSLGGSAGGDGSNSRSGNGGDAPGGSTSGLGAATGIGGGGTGAAAGSNGLSDAGTDSGSSGPLPPSCVALEPQCGDAANRASCCESLPVLGGSFDMLVQTEGVGVPVTVSSFHLDRFEVTVGRMREFIAHYDEWRAQGQPQQGLGEHPLIPGSGWQVDRFSPFLPESAADFETRLRDCGPTPFSTYAEGLSDEVPLNCASWFEAAAFCAWDGGRLPTMRELAYAGYGGAQQRVYPWGDEPVPRRELALFGCIIDTDAPVCTIADVTPVGVRPLGAGLFGQDDLAGSMSEWVLDANAAPDSGCTDCADLAPVGDESLRRWRPGDWLTRADLLRNGIFLALPPDIRNYFLGLRCARDE
ncbi:MAG TPA: formylglycine-generating enzyme family protein [Polyangiaceae bacterium]|nr:formylglycine-generating enzyme family protein [Polyangiaceae bacterium]